jgi:hypothetical protein
LQQPYFQEGNVDETDTSDVTRQGGLPMMMRVQRRFGGNRQHLQRSNTYRRGTPRAAAE